MSEKIVRIFEEARYEAGKEKQWGTTDLDVAKKFADFILAECFVYLNDEIQRLTKYSNTLPEYEKDKLYDVDLCIEKCLDNIQGLKEHFGVKE
jgi:hypothetical protein